MAAAMSEAGPPVSWCPGLATRGSSRQGSVEESHIERCLRRFRRLTLQPPTRSIGDVALPESGSGQNPANEDGSPPSPVGLQLL